MSARPFQVGDPVLIDGTPGKVWWIDGPDLDNEFGGDFATVYIRYDALNEVGADGTAVIMTPDLSASKYPQRTLALLESETLDLQAIGAEAIAEYAPVEDFAADALAAVEQPRFAPPADSVWDPRLPHPGDIDEGPVQARWSQAGVMSVRGVA